jgi:hypothetical protein
LKGSIGVFVTCSVNQFPIPCHHVGASAPRPETTKRIANLELNFFDIYIRINSIIFSKFFKD